MKTILGCAMAVGLLGSCLAGVKGDSGPSDCQSDLECGGGTLGQRCSRGECVNAPCNIDTDCDAFAFGLVCDRGEECRRPCAGYYGGCPAGTECVDTFCELAESTGNLSVGFPRPLGPGAAGGGGEPPGLPIPDEYYGYDYGDGN